MVVLNEDSFIIGFWFFAFRGERPGDFMKAAYRDGDGALHLRWRFRYDDDRATANWYGATAPAEKHDQEVLGDVRAKMAMITFAHPDADPPEEFLVMGDIEKLMGLPTPPWWNSRMETVH